MSDILEKIKKDKVRILRDFSYYTKNLDQEVIDKCYELFLDLVDEEFVKGIFFDIFVHSLKENEKKIILEILNKYGIDDSIKVAYEICHDWKFNYERIEKFELVEKFNKYFLENFDEKKAEKMLCKHYTYNNPGTSEMTLLNTALKNIGYEKAFKLSELSTNKYIIKKLNEIEEGVYEKFINTVTPLLNEEKIAELFEYDNYLYKGIIEKYDKIKAIHAFIKYTKEFEFYRIQFKDEVREIMRDEYPEKYGKSLCIEDLKDEIDYNLFLKYKGVEYLTNEELREFEEKTGNTTLFNEQLKKKEKEFIEKYKDKKTFVVITYPDYRKEISIEVLGVANTPEKATEIARNSTKEELIYRSVEDINGYVYMSNKYKFIYQYKEY